jgi:hypothetical protein
MKLFSTVVHRGEWNKRNVAIKQIKDSDLMESFLEEANLMAYVLS